MINKRPDTDEYKEAVKPLEKLLGRNFTATEYKDVYYAVFESPSDNGYKNVIKKYAVPFYNYQVHAIEEKLLVSLFKKYGLTPKDLNRAFEIRITKVLSKTRVFPTPAELLVLVKPDAIVNIYDSQDRKKSTEVLSDEEVRANEIKNQFKRFYKK